jgi:oxygen-independent coproporphyrinogen III oxidase
VSGVYISFPFCAQKCTFCNFVSGIAPGEVRDGYVRAVTREIERHPWAWTPDTVYLGGGTPSLMEPAELEAVLGSVPGRPWKEATIECAPGGVTEARAALWREAGLTRVSLGVQSFVPREAARTGRKHTPEIVATEMAVLRAAGFERFNIDLIAGLAGQTEASWGESLDWLERLEPGHASVYMLEVDGDSRLGAELLAGGKRYGAGDVPSDDQVAALYEAAVERLERAGMPRYEISNFARHGEESLHNLKYWRLEPYAGFGADAHSFDGRLRRRNAETTAEYMARAGDPCVETVEAHPEEEKFFVGLRLAEGVRPSAEEWERHGAAIRRFAHWGLMESRDGVVRLTPRGVLLSNEVFEEFLSR